MNRMTSVNLLISIAQERIAELRVTTGRARRRDLRKLIDRIAELLGSDVVARIEGLVRSRRDVDVHVFDGRCCSTTKAELSVQARSLMRLRGVTPCEFCSEILIDDAEDAWASDIDGYEICAV